YPRTHDLPPFSVATGWMAWCHGTVKPPAPGRYRFWGYADNHLLVAIDGTPVFEGSRYDSNLTKLAIPRTNHPAIPCLNATAGFASGQWVELTGAPIQLDILFGESAGDRTSGLLLIEKEGASYEETYWGQPKWPVFLVNKPNREGAAELRLLRRYLEEKLMGSFSLDNSAIWQAQR
ncbi:MAG: hypothetical protein AAF226_04120, partial [Verrucomicrobiota bacterium]